MSANSNLPNNAFTKIIYSELKIKTMKHFAIIILAGLAAIAFSCTKETTPEQTTPEPQEMGVDGDIVCIDGTLHFPRSLALQRWMRLFRMRI